MDQSSEISKYFLFFSSISLPEGLVLPHNYKLTNVAENFSKQSWFTYLNSKKMRILNYTKVAISASLKIDFILSWTFTFCFMDHLLPAWNM